MDDKRLSCPECLHSMVKMMGDLGGYYACRNRPQCETILNLNDAKIRLAEIVAGIKPSAVNQKPDCIDDETGDLCPVCDEPMIIRFSNKNNNKFYGCTDYPNCRGTREV